LLGPGLSHGIHNDSGITTRDSIIGEDLKQRRRLAQPLMVVDEIADTCQPNGSRLPLGDVESELQRLVSKDVRCAVTGHGECEDESDGEAREAPTGHDARAVPHDMPPWSVPRI
jgi:hypothetical protein